MSYIDYDEAGVVEIRCMNCGTPVVKRDYVEVPDKNSVNGAVKVMTPKRLSNYRQVDLDFDSGDRKSYASPIVCVECEGKELDGEKLLKAITDGWLKEADHYSVDSKKVKKLKKLIPGMKAVGKVQRRAE